MSVPVVVKGMLTSGSNGYPRPAGAHVDAYALIADGMDGQRAIPIGSATADDMGYFVLLLPSSTDDIHW
jgi:hypothetical protein